MPQKKRRVTKKESKTDRVEFRERKFSDILAHPIQHPMPIPGYKSTLPGPPGWDSKENPLGIKVSMEFQEKPFSKYRRHSDR